MRRFLAFWVEFVVGDDWRIAAAVVAALAVAVALDAWWPLPPAVVLVLAWSLRRATMRA